MGSYLLIAGIVVAVLVLAVYWHRRSRSAETQASQNSAILGDFITAEMAMKASQLESYKQMLRNPNPRSQHNPQTPRSGGIDWEEINGDRRRF